METRFDDVTHIVTEDEPIVCWKVTRMDDHYGNPIFRLDYEIETYEGTRLKRQTVYTETSMAVADRCYKLIRTEKDFLIWNLKYGHRL